MSTRQVQPAAGFVDRFHVRLEKRRREQTWRQVTGTLVLVLGGFGLVYWLAGPLIQQALQSPAAWITAGVGYFLFILTSLQVLSEASSYLVARAACLHYTCRLDRPDLWALPGSDFCGLFQFGGSPVPRKECER